MHRPVLFFIGFLAIAGTMVALILEVTKEVCNERYGETVNGEYSALE